MAKNNIIPIFIPFGGCPYKCVYCNQEKITGKYSLPSLKQVGEIIEEYASYFIEESPIEVAFYGGTFTMLDFKDQKAYANLVKKYIDNGLVSSMRVSTRPDAIDKSEIIILKKLGLSTIELGIQSIDPEVLQSSGRNINIGLVEENIAFLKEEGFNLGLQQMIGLPFDSFEKTLKTSRWIINQGADFVRIYPTIVLENTKLAQMYIEGSYKPLSFMEAIFWSAQLLETYESEGIEVIRVGLPPLENLSDFLDGPYDLQFREYAESLRFVKKIILYIENINDKEKIKIKAHQRIINKLVGPKKFGLNLLIENGIHPSFENDIEDNNIEIITREERVVLKINEIGWRKICI